jgi:glycosyltransferase involved in cell wall biosynthesis
VDKNTATTGPLANSEADEGRIAAALSGWDHVCFGHDWTGDPLSKTHIMRALAREGRVLWINSIGYRTPTASTRDLRRLWNKLKEFTKELHEAEPNIWVLSPLAIPLYDSPLVQRINRWLLRSQVRRACRRLHFRRVLDWVFTPTAAVVAGSLGEEKVVYYCVDDFTAFSGAGTPALAVLEEQLLRRADLVVVSSQTLLQSKSRHNPKTVLLRHGVQYDLFRTALDAATRIPDDVAKLPAPIIGYFGLLAEDWVDLELLDRIARRFEHGSVVLLGDVMIDVTALACHPNVHLLGRRPFEELPAYCKAFDVAINIFPLNAATRHANPLKVREYLAAGLPVVSTRIPEVEVLSDLVYIADSHDEFIAKLEEALRHPGAEQSRSLRMKNDAWEARYLDLKRHLLRQGVV